VQGGELVAAGDHVGGEPERLEHPDRDRIALGVDPGPVERVLARGDLEEPGRLGEGDRPDPLDLHQLLAVVVGTVLRPVVDHPTRRELVQARDVAQERDAGRVEVDPHEVDAAGDDRLERLLELLGIDVVLVEADADVLGLDLDQLGERVLEPPADRDRAAERGVVLGELLAADRAGRVDAGAGLVDDDVGELREAGVGRMRLGRAWGCFGRGGRGES
jgi:hypothetical protein